MPRVVRPSSVHNLGYSLLGLGILALNKLRHGIRGYRTPRPFSVTDFDRAIDYDLEVLDSWLGFLEEYLGGPVSLEGKTVLELGPGADLGVGLLLLARGVARYHAFDVHDLAAATPAGFYDELLARLSRDKVDEKGLERLRREIGLLTSGGDGDLDYLCRPDFDLSVLPGQKIDYVFSQAAFEHFANPPRVIAQLSDLLPPGAVLVAEIDLQTHTRWIRDADPLNIYRYPDLLYRLCRFSGSPNRYRPTDYEELLRRHGWSRIRSLPLATLESRYLARIQPWLRPRFREAKAQMSMLDMVLCATR